MTYAKLSKEQLRKLKDMCKQENYEAVVALLQYHIQEAVQVLKFTNDPRYMQGKVQALEDLLDDIVKKPS